MRKDILIGCDQHDLNLNTPVLNLSAIREYILVQIPKELCSYKLYEMYDISSGKPREVKFYGKVIKDRMHPWMQIPAEVMSLRAGKHTYRLDFLDTDTADIQSLFIAYIIQDDDPETPYVYMPNRGNANPADNKWKDGQYSNDFYDQLKGNADAVNGYDPLLMGQEIRQSSPCATCTRPDCVDCPYKEGV